MKVICDYCGQPAVRVTGREIYPHRPDLKRLHFWQCAPCEAFVGCHKHSDGVPLGRLANARLRAAKSRAHEAFDPLWRYGEMTRSSAYAWLADAMELRPAECHIGMFNEEQCAQVVSLATAKDFE